MTALSETSAVTALSIYRGDNIIIYGSDIQEYSNTVTFITMSAKPVLLHFKIANFAQLKSTIGSKSTQRPQVDCNGNSWSLVVYPGGAKHEGEGWVGLFLQSYNGESHNVKFTLCVKDTFGNTVREYTGCGSATSLFGRYKFLERTRVLDEANNILVGGSLTVNATIQIKSKSGELFRPTEHISNRMLNLLESGKDSDTTIKVSNKYFRVHSLILGNNAPGIASFCDPKKTTVIKDTTPAVFKIILEYVYSGFDPTLDETMLYAKELIDGANKYELVDLKMAVENMLVQECIINKENVADYIVFADAQCCALLKEYAISYFALHAKEILKSEHSKNLRESSQLLSEIIIGMSEDRDADTVTKLRKQLGKRNLDVDGTKDTLIARLEDAKKQRTDN